MEARNDNNDMKLMIKAAVFNLYTKGLEFLPPESKLQGIQDPIAKRSKLITY